MTILLPKEPNDNAVIALRECGLKLTFQAYDQKLLIIELYLIGSKLEISIRQ